MSASFLSTSTLLSDANTAQSVVYWLALGLVAGGLTLMCVVLIDRWKRRKQESMGESASGGVPIGTIPEAERLLQLMGEAEELCARLSNDLDQKAEHLQRLIERAEQIGVMPPATANAPTVRPVPVPPPAVPTASNPDPSGPLSRLMREQHAAEAMVAPTTPARTPEIVTRIPERRVPAPVVSEPVVRSAAAQSSTPTQPGPAAGLEPLASQIYQLADRGMTPREIAQSLQQHPGKVELILALRST